MAHRRQAAKKGMGKGATDGLCVRPGGRGWARRGGRVREARGAHGWKGCQGPSYEGAGTFDAAIWLRSRVSPVLLMLPVWAHRNQTGKVFQEEMLFRLGRPRLWAGGLACRRELNTAHGMPWHSKGAGQDRAAPPAWACRPRRCDRGTAKAARRRSAGVTADAGPRRRGLGLRRGGGTAARRRLRARRPGRSPAAPGPALPCAAASGARPARRW